MIYIDFKKTQENHFVSIFNKIYKNKPPTVGLYDPSAIGKIDKSILVLDPKKIEKINPDVQLENLRYGGLTLAWKIDGGSGDHDLNQVIEEYRIKEIIVENSNLNKLILGDKLSDSNYLKLIIKNSKIKYYEISQSEGQVGKTIHIECEFKNFSADIIKIKGTHRKDFRYIDLHTKFLLVESNNIIFENSSFSVPIFEKPSDLKLHFKQSRIIYDSNLFSTIGQMNFDEIDELKIGVKDYRDIIASLKFLAGLPESESFIKDLEKTYAFFESRRNIFRRLLFFYTEYYYKLSCPVIGLLILSIAFQYILQNADFNHNNLGLSQAFIPTEFVKEILFKDFKLSLRWGDISFEKVFLALLVVPIYYSLFSFVMAVKKNLGYRKLR